MSDTVWIMAQNKAFGDDGWVTDWELGGIFTSEEQAVAACTEPTDTVWPVTLNEVLPRETTEPPHLRFPLADQPE
ncbi:hypothetical protein [Streptomyces sp. NPDC006997]|uniref:hypothetical protein n=1 Tax=Streptomyces sp. NPDC006997 TaxID=3155356 RepID=UPI0033D7D5A6